MRFNYDVNQVTTEKALMVSVGDLTSCIGSAKELKPGAVDVSDSD